MFLSNTIVILLGYIVRLYEVLGQAGEGPKTIVDARAKYSKYTTKIKKKQEKVQFIQ